uniref:Notchless-like protein 1 n=1 Tax=Pipistrellus kuhlii TaxID=59472 RepID=A0A7J7U881_PIPKU|nr:notchless-like protein 1 [Pipistrellus kuhlii]
MPPDMEEMTPTWTWPVPAACRDRPKAGVVTRRTRVACCPCTDPRAEDQRSQEVTTELSPGPAPSGVTGGGAVTRPCCHPCLLSQLPALFRVRPQVL